MHHANDPASLDNLHDIVLPEPLSLWWPLAPGWWIVLAAVVIVTAWAGYKAWRRWRANAYRRAALTELDQIDDIGRISTVLKRTALAAYPREAVAALSGNKWIAFLNNSAPAPHFKGQIGDRLVSVATTRTDLTDGQKSELVAAARMWILGHKGRR